MFKWYVVNTYSGHENKVKANLEMRVKTLDREDSVKRVVVPTETVQETKDGQKVQTEKRVLPGYVLVHMNDLSTDNDLWSIVRNTPGVTGFVGADRKPVALSPIEVRGLLRQNQGGTAGDKPKLTVQFSVGESVKVIAGPLADFTGDVVEVNGDAQRLKVLISIFGRETPAELAFDQVKKVA